jgi:hypothetical protein
MEQLDADQYRQLSDNFKHMTTTPGVSYEAIRQSMTFINEYRPVDVLRASFRPESEIFWQISSDSLTSLKNDLSNSSRPMNFNFHLEFKRPMKDKESTVHSLDLSYPLKQTDKQALLNTIVSDKRFILNNSLPVFVRVPSITASGIEVMTALQRASYVPMNQTMTTVNESLSYSNWTTKLRKEDNQRLWEVRLDLNQNLTNFLLEDIDYGSRNKSYIQIIGSLLIAYNL